MENIIDRNARDNFSELLRHLASGQITNDQFEDSLPLNSKDPAVNAVFWNGAWMLYDDLREYKLKGKYRLPKEAKHEIAKWILFLKSDLPYEWPSVLWLNRFPGYIIHILTLGIAWIFTDYKLKKAGDIEAWPFIRLEDLEKEKNRANTIKTI